MVCCFGHALVVVLVCLLVGDLFDYSTTLIVLMILFCVFCGVVDLGLYLSDWLLFFGGDIALAC